MKINQFSNRLVKAGRIVSDRERLDVQAAKRDVGHLREKQYSTIAQRKVPKALHEIYGLPKRNKRRSEAEQAKFK